mgnify:CR=1 FL=1
MNEHPQHIMNKFWISEQQYDWAVHKKNFGFSSEDNAHLLQGLVFTQFKEDCNNLQDVHNNDMQHYGCQTLHDIATVHWLQNWKLLASLSVEISNL